MRSICKRKTAVSRFPFAAHDSGHVTACVLEDPPFFHVTPEQVAQGAGAFVLHDGYNVARDYVETFVRSMN